MKDKLRRYLTKQLRRAFNYSPLKRELLKVLPNHCAECGITGSDMHLDHVLPVVPTDRQIHSLEYFMRLFSIRGDESIDLSNFQKLCHECHRAKSKEEMGSRARNKTGPYSEEAKAKRSAKRGKTKKRSKRCKRKVRSKRT